ncbi:MAG: translation initiation factor IF-2 [Verrucomicrobiales bacterium]|nr:translation initiation factor IF-2 [Verrucomicrobiales bacterium]
MPVRIYEIAKLVGVESKVVLAKAKDLEIAAKVASSSIDKITAEYLIEQLRKDHPAPAEPAPGETAEYADELQHATAVETEPTDEIAPATDDAPPAADESEPAPEPPVIEPAPAPEDSPIAAAATAEAPATEAAIEPVQATGAPPPDAEIMPAPEITPERHAEPTAAEAPVEPPPPQAEPASPDASPVSPPEVTDGTHQAESPAAAAPPAAAPTESPAEEEPAKPDEPAKPGIGQLVGRINLQPWSFTKGREREREHGRKRGEAKGRGEGRADRGARQAQGGGTPVESPARGGSKLPPLPPPESLTAGEIVIKPPIIIRDLAEKLGRKPHQIIADLMEMGVFATVNQSIEPEIAQRICAKRKMRFRLEKRDKGGALVREQPKKPELVDEDDRPEDLKPRPPVITIMGHVDHGKTTLLDTIRKSNVVAGEAGGITQHIGAYTIHFPHPERPDDLQQITFIDTPGHAAFSAMRARGANVTDIVILVVAADDGVKPQTLEALDHARAAGVPIIVAVNKCDHPAANPMRARQQLQERGLAPDEWGGDTIFVDLSALTREGVDRLLEMILLQAEILELRANPDRRARGNVVESGIEPGGPTATVLVRKGTLHPGDVIVCGPHYGRVRALINEDGRRLKEAGPSYAVKVLGLNGVPEAGAEFEVAENERMARQVCEERAAEIRKAQLERPKAATPTNLGEIINMLRSDAGKVLKVQVKADTQGSVEAIVSSLEQIHSEKVSLEVIAHGVGNITEKDVELAAASSSIILGFHAKIDHAAAEAAKRRGVEIRLYAIIYELVDEVRLAMAGLLDPLLKEVTIGTAEVRKIFELSKGGNVAGCAVTQGRITRGKARVIRRKNLLYQGLVSTLRRFQDEVNEVRTGMECGIRLDGFDEFQEGDIIECVTIEKEAQQL